MAISDSFRIVVCASGGGGNFQALIDARAQLGMEIACLLVDRPCGATARAERHGIAWRQLDAGAGDGGFEASFAAAIPAHTQLVVLAGFLPIVPAGVCSKWQGRIINIHPSLLPRHGGKGMYGVRVQEAVLAAGDQQAGCTVHHVTAVIDGGAMIAQQSIDVIAGESAWQLGGRVFEQENMLLVKAVDLVRQALLAEDQIAQTALFPSRKPN